MSIDRRDDSSSLLRLAFLTVFAAALFLALLARLWYLQVLIGDRFVELADSNRLRTVVTQAARGHVLARGGEELVRNRAALALTADRQVLLDDGGRPRDAEAEVVVDRVAELLLIDEEELLRRMADPRTSPFRPVTIAVDIAPEIVFAVRENQELFRGINAETVPVREYPQGTVAAHLVGYLGQISEDELGTEAYEGYRGGDLVGRGGVEQAYEADLRGTTGQRILVVNRRGDVLEVQSERDPVEGDDLVLTLDLDLQVATEILLERGIIASRSILRDDGRTLPSTAGSAIVLDARTGAVLAMASYPSFDPRRFVGGVSSEYWEFVNDPEQDRPLVNRPIAGQYPPGSVFKTASGAAMIEAGVAAPSTRVPCPGSFVAADVTFRNWNPADEGAMDLTTALMRSCDTYFYRLAFEQWQRAQRTEQPDEVLATVAGRFGFGRRTGIDLPGEQAGVVPGPTWRREYWLQYRDGYCQQAAEAEPGSLEQELLEDLCRFGGLWRGGDAVNTSIGQGDVLSTPLQVAVSYQAIANGGVMMRPHVGDRVVATDGTLVRVIEPESIGDLGLSAESLGAIRRGLQRVVMDPRGTAAGAFAGFPLDRIPVAGKTGTAERNPRVPYAWFAAYAPADAPEVVVVVAIEEGGGGSQTAAPITRTILEHWFGVRRAPEAEFRAGPAILD